MDRERLNVWVAAAIQEKMDREVAATGLSEVTTIVSSREFGVHVVAGGVFYSYDLRRPR